MTLTNSRATIGLQSRLTPTNTNVFGQIQVGENNKTISYPDSNAIYSLQAFFSNASNSFELDSATGIASSISPSWVAGTAQVETATAAGTATASGDVTITITASGLTGSPKSIAVPITSGDTASVWAGKVRTALAADTAVTALFSVSGTTTSIVLTRKPSQTIEGSNISVPYYVANDSTLNIAITAGSTGVTSAATSANTTAGVATSGCLVMDADGNDIEGNEIGTLASIDSALFEASGNIEIIGSGWQYSHQGTCFFSGLPSASTIYFTANSAPSSIKVTILGTI